MTNYRICRISRIAYRPALASLYIRDPALADAPYDAQLQALFDNSLVYSDSFSDAMRRLGNDAVELISNAETIQKTWAQEHGTAYSPMTGSAKFSTRRSKRFDLTLFSFRG